MSIEAIQPSQFFSLQALPPGMQEAREKEAILNDPQVKQYLDSIGARSTEVMSFAILDNGSKQYLVKTNMDYFIRVNVVYTHDEKVLGPKKFTLDVFAPEVPKTYVKGLIFPANQKA